MNTVPATHACAPDAQGHRLDQQYVAEVRETVGDEVPIGDQTTLAISASTTASACGSSSRLTWPGSEDMVPCAVPDKWVQLERSLNTPVCTGEDIYLAENFRPLIHARGVNIVHPDLATSGGIWRPEDRRPGAGVRRQHGPAYGSGTPINTMAASTAPPPLRELYRAGAPLHRAALLERFYQHQRRDQADHPAGLYPGARGAGPGLRRSTKT